MAHSRRVLLALVLVLVSSPAASNPPPAGTEPLAAPPEAAPRTEDGGCDREALTAANLALAGDLYRVLRERPGNGLFSPYLVSRSLAMMSAGAAGDTARQIAQVGHFDLPPARLHAAFRALEQGWDETFAPWRERGARVDLGAQGFAQVGYPFRPEFLATLSDHYAAPVRRVDLTGDPKGAAAAINAWCGDLTHGHIERLVEPTSFGRDSRMVWVSALYLGVPWDSSFEASATRDKPFHLLGGTTVQVPTMVDRRWVRYVARPGWAAISLAYEVGALELAVILPDVGGFERFESHLDGQRLGEILEALSAHGSRVDVALPRFRFAGETDITPVLSQLGMPLAFDERRADFTKASPKGLRITDMFQRADIQVDETGTELAVVMGVSGGVIGGVGLPPPPPPRFEADRPFLFAVWDRDTRTVLVLGRVVDPR